MKRQLITLTLGLSPILQAAALENITVGDPQYGGTGCPSGSVATTLSPDATSLSILFDQYVVEAGHQVGKSFDRKSCNVAIPVHVPQGFSVGILAIDYRGFNMLPRGATSTFSVEYFFAGLQGPRFMKSFYGALESDYLITNKLQATALVWSKCGEDVILRTNTSIRLSTNRMQDQAMATVDSQDVNASVVYQLQWKRCN